MSEQIPEGTIGFDRKLTGEEINRLPVRRYRGPIRVVRTMEEMARATRALRREKVLGFDTESRPAFKKGQQYPPALLQLTGAHATYIFQLRYSKLPRSLREILSNRDTIKAGAALERDVAELRELGAFEPAGFVDLGQRARALGMHHHGLRGLAAVLLGFRIPKGMRLSNWGAKELTSAQLNYAATDSWVSREIFLKLQEHAKQQTPKPHPTPPEGHAG